MNNYRRIIMSIAAGVLLVGPLSAGAALTPDELLQAVDQMSPAQVQSLQKKLDSKTWKPVPEGFFTRMALNADISFSTLDKVDLSSLALSGGKMDVDEVSGIDFAVFWRLFNEHFRLGVRMGSWYGSDSNLSDAGYSSAEITGFEGALVLHYQWIRSDRWLLWTEVAVGGGSVELETVDTPTGQATTLRKFDKDYAQADVQVGASLRLNPVLNLFVSGGYRFAESVHLEEGGRKGDIAFDASGALGRVGVGFNF